MILTHSLPSSATENSQVIENSQVPEGPRLQRSDEIAAKRTARVKEG